MSDFPAGAEVMAKAQKSTPVRLTDDAVKWARIASGLTGESVAEYASRRLAEVARADAEELFPKAKAEPTVAPKARAKKPKGGKG